MDKPRLAAFPAALFLAGLALSMYGGRTWWLLPDYSEQEIEQSTELNLALDLQRGPARRPPLSIEEYRQQIQDELRAEIRREKHETLRILGVGLSLLALAAVQFWIAVRAHKAGTKAE